MVPPITTATKNNSKPPPSKPPKSIIAVATIDANPAAGPETPRGELLKEPTTIPPIIPAIILIIGKCRREEAAMKTGTCNFRWIR